MRTEKPRSLERRIEVLERDLGRLSDAEAEALIDSLTDEELTRLVDWCEARSPKRTPEQREAERQRVHFLPSAEIGRALKPVIEHWRSIGSPSGNDAD